MGNSKLVGSQLTNLITYQRTLDENYSLAKNVFEIGNTPKTIDMGYVNGKLIKDGAVAYYIDENENLEKVMYCLPFETIVRKKPYGLPSKIEVKGEDGFSKVLNEDEFVIMYDNTEKRPIWLDILMYSERLSECTRTCDININQQRTPRIWNVPSDKEKTFRDMINNVDSYSDSVVAYEGLNLEGISCILEPAPYIADKVDLHKKEVYNEFLSFIGISTIQFNKKERMISSEIKSQTGGSIAQRFSRFLPRKEAIEEINKKFKEYLEKPLTLRYYDGEPSTEKNIESEVDKNDISNVSDDDRNV
jgi:hypothetical protein